MAKLLYVVGLGPGAPTLLTGQAKAALDDAQLLCGYKVYIDLVAPLYPGKPTLTTAMTQEVERCRLALEAADRGQTTAMVCSGDAGVYGMAGPILEMAPTYPEVEVVVVPGLSAALTGAAVLGAPLMHDFCVISLSDRLTPWPVIEARLEAAARSDFCICLYNPSSRARADYLAKACAILARSLPADRVCGWVKNIGRPGQTSWTGTLAQLAEEQVDMFTTVFIGNHATRLTGQRMVTPRGYRL